MEGFLIRTPLTLKKEYEGFFCRKILRILKSMMLEETSKVVISRKQRRLRALQDALEKLIL
jgi:hypothetical protein